MAGAARKLSNIAMWGILALLVVGLAGFGIGNFGGGVRAIGAVGDTEIPADDYARALQAELRARGRATGQAVSLASPEGQALAAAVRRQVIGAAALDGEAARVGLSVGDGAVRDAVMAVPAFQGPDGRFDRAAYAETLRQNGLSESAFEEAIRRESARTLIGLSVAGGVTAPPAFAATLAAYLGERRDLLWLRLDAAALPAPPPAPDAAAVRAFYAANPDLFTEPEKKRIAYLWLSPEMMLDRVTVDEAALRALYDERAAEYNRPERRLVERLVFPDRAAAEAARAALDAGGASFESLVTGRGLRLADVDLGDVSAADLGAAGPAVFALDAPGVTGVVETDLGPALFRVNAILPAESTPFEAVREELRAEVALARARRAVAGEREAIDDLLAGGATFEEVAAETPAETGTLDFAEGDDQGIAAYAAFRDAARALTEADFPVLRELEDGGLFALDLVAVMPAAVLPFEEVEARAAELARRAAETEALTALAETLKARRAAGETWEAMGFEPQRREGLARDSYVDGAPEGLVAAAFRMAEGEVAMFPGDGTVSLVELERLRPADPEAPDAQLLEAAIEQAAAQGLAQDLVDLFTAAIEAEAGIRLNEAAIAAVHAQFP
jgi:peptidyl-prolyl cis-trans isomerase D